MVTLIDAAGPIASENKGGYGKALEWLAGLLGCTDGLWQQLCDEPVGDVQPEQRTGWCVVGDGEGEDRIYNDAKLLATVQWSSRAFWHATAYLADGSTLYSKGANVELACEPWRNAPY